MIEQERYDILWKAFELSCDMLSNANMEITDDNKDIIEFKIFGSLKGYFLMKAEAELKK